MCQSSNKETNQQWSKMSVTFFIKSLKVDWDLATIVVCVNLERFPWWSSYIDETKRCLRLVKNSFQVVNNWLAFRHWYYLVALPSIWKKAIWSCKCSRVPWKSKNSLIWKTQLLGLFLSNFGMFIFIDHNIKEIFVLPKKFSDKDVNFNELRPWPICSIKVSWICNHKSSKWLSVEAMYYCKV